MQIGMGIQILSGARHALISTRECQAMLNLGEYLCYSLNTSNAALACMAAQQSHQGRHISPVSMWCCSASAPPQILTFLWCESYTGRTGELCMLVLVIPPVGNTYCCVFSKALLFACTAGDKGKFLFVTLPYYSISILLDFEVCNFCHCLVERSRRNCLSVQSKCIRETKTWAQVFWVAKALVLQSILLVWRKRECCRWNAILRRLSGTFSMLKLLNLSDSFFYICCI